MRRLVPVTVLSVFVALVAAAAGLGITDAATTDSATKVTVAPIDTLEPGDTGGQTKSVFVGMSVDQASKYARSHGVAIEYWRVPTTAPSGTVLEQLSENPVYLVVSSGPPRNLWADLPLALGPPVHLECVPGFELSADGNAGPATCAGGRVNVAVWDYVAASRPPMLALGRSASECEAARDYDDEQFTAQMNATVFALADAYYGWTFGSRLTDELDKIGPLPFAEAAAPPGGWSCS